ncbi:hypothetical protein CEQ90_05580 [Lewinellaceae bacterium SD302]|nr:hypothetical protein CEQ90_05580 [Lewinellaceae bacterium SD302]
MIKHILKLIWNRKGSNVLLFTEIFFCFIVVFLVSAFCIKNFRAYFSPYGYEVENLWVLKQQATNLLDSTDFVQAQEMLKREILALDGVESAGFAGYAIPFSGSMWTNGGDEMGFDFYTTMIGGDEDYAKTMGIELREGRYFTEDDYRAKVEPIIINQKISEDFFDGGSMIDSILKLGDAEYKIVGVAENIRYRDGFEDEYPTSIILTKQAEKEAVDLLVRVAPGSGPELEQAMGRVVFNVLKTEDFNITILQKQRESIARDTWVPIIIFLVIGTFLILNIALGLFGVLFYTISKRKGEIGVRRAMGAHRGEIIRQFVLEIYFVALAAMALGVVLALQVPLLGLIEADDFAHSNLYYAIGFSFLLITLVVIGCAYWPSRQGANLHPALALHEE